ncbi:MAG: ABC transporter substrate-binding protein, partial [Geminicoccaceae bacterium]
MVFLFYEIGSVKCFIVRHIFPDWLLTAIVDPLGLNSIQFKAERPRIVDGREGATRHRRMGDLIMVGKNKGRLHPYIPKLIKQLEGQKVDRREFLRTATLLGVSSAAAYGIAGRILGDGVTEPALAQDAEPKVGGVLRCSMPVQEMADPATFDWVEKSNIARHLCEFLTYTGPDNVTRPYLAESWEASDDLTSWTFYLRQGIKWNNG